MAEWQRFFAVSMRQFDEGCLSIALPMARHFFGVEKIAGRLARCINPRANTCLSYHILALGLSDYHAQLGNGYKFLECSVS